MLLCRPHAWPSLVSMQWSTTFATDLPRIRVDRAPPGVCYGASVYRCGDPVRKAAQRFNRFSAQGRSSGEEICLCGPLACGIRSESNAVDENDEANEVSHADQPQENGSTTRDDNED